MMDPRLALVSLEDRPAWSDNQSQSSDDGPRDVNMPPAPSPSPRDNLAMAMSAARFSTGQVSPVSSGLDVAMDSSAPTMINSASSSTTENWSLGPVDRDDNWEHDSDDGLAVPKVEPVEDDLTLGGLTSRPLDVLPSGGHVKPKRPRGRPRKHPVAPAASASKVTKGRSKTGCITCRKRKKKCDEAKPRCMNCEKNRVVCEGYYEKQIWKSGREIAEEERMKRDALPNITIPPIFHGVETAEDRAFWKHYIKHFSNIFTVEGEARNAFKDVLLQLANQHQGLMHSILAVSSMHIDLDEPYGATLLRENPTTSRESLQERFVYHHDAAMTRLYEDMAKELDKDDPAYETTLSARYGQILCLLLQTRADGNPRGEHRLHLQAYKTLMQHSPPSDPVFRTFITEFFQFHIYADDLFWHPELNVARLSDEDWQPCGPIHPPRLLGVADGLFRLLSQITTIRNTIRANIATSAMPLVDYTSLYRAAEIDSAIRAWAPQWPPGDGRDKVALLYKQVMWVYLFRTIYPPSALPCPLRRSTLSSYPASPVSPMPIPGMPVRRASTAGSLGASALPPTPEACMRPLNGLRLPHSCPSSRNPSRTNSMHESVSQTAPAPTPVRHRPASPPPIRRPAHHDRRIAPAVEESLTLLESFNASEPCQTLLLIPCLVIGTACFDAAQQDRIRNGVKAVRGYTGLKTCDRVSELLEEVWAAMDHGDWLSVWDWQGLARRSGLDFLCT